MSVDRKGGKKVGVSVYGERNIKRGRRGGGETVSTYTEWKGKLRGGKGGGKLQHVHLQPNGLAWSQA